MEGEAAAGEDAILHYAIIRGDCGGENVQAVFGAIDQVKRNQAPLPPLVPNRIGKRGERVSCALVNLRHRGTGDHWRVGGGAPPTRLLPPPPRTARGALAR